MRRWCMSGFCFCWPVYIFMLVFWFFRRCHNRSWQRHVQRSIGCENIFFRGLLKEVLVLLPSRMIWQIISVMSSGGYVCLGPALDLRGFVCCPPCMLLAACTLSSLGCIAVRERFCFGGAFDPSFRVSVRANAVWYVIIFMSVMFRVPRKRGSRFSGRFFIVDTFAPRTAIARRPFDCRRSLRIRSANEKQKIMLVMSGNNQLYLY